MSGWRDNTPRTPDHNPPTPAPVTASVTAADLGPGRLHALVISDKLVATYPLPDSGIIKIGRSPQCEIQIDDTSISRTHASISIGPPLAVADLGSANGTRVRDRRVEKDQLVEVQPGEAIQVGNATVILQRHAVPIPPRRLWTHDYFEVRLEEECARAGRRGLTFAVMRVHCTSATKPEAIQQALGDLVRMSDVVGEYGPSD